MGARLFSAVLPPADLVDTLDAFLEPRRQAEPRLRWTRPDTWHLTTAFMADVPERSVDRLEEGLAAVAASTAPFAVHVLGAGAFPWAREAKHVWLGVQEGADALARLSRRTRAAAAHAGVAVDGATFTPHLTLGRANRVLDATRLLRVLDGFDSEPWRAEEFVLIASHLHDRTNRYEVVGRHRLAGASEHGDAAGTVGGGH